nr:prolipoprotein diacylglyceryl transferase family protein [Chloroflexus sp.]
MYPPVDPVIIQLGPLTLRWYGVLIMAGVMLTAWVGSRHVERREFDRESVWDLLLWGLIPGLLGVRLYYSSSSHRVAQKDWGAF